MTVSPSLDFFVFLQGHLFPALPLNKVVEFLRKIFFCSQGLQLVILCERYGKTVYCLLIHPGKVSSPVPVVSCRIPGTSLSPVPCVCVFATLINHKI